ncbi:MAG: hypothetical protein GKR90_01380 [Pseudomonadales bacterium]|nr:hypothetical protein [Pseudomonadales bacterium]
MKKLHRNALAWGIGLMISATSVLATGNEKTEKDTVIKKGDIVTVKADEKICKRVAQTGTRFKKKVCMPASEWAELQRDSQETLRAVAGPAGNSGS